MKAITRKTKSGFVVRQAHQQTLISILHDSDAVVPTIKSQGSSYSNRNAWTMRMFCHAICTRKVTPAEAKLYADSRIGSVEPQVTIASTPDEVQAQVELYLRGGATHEALHSLLSALGRVPDWVVAETEAKMKSFNYIGLESQLQSMTNIIEDVRIERYGCATFPGARLTLEALADSLYEMETTARSSHYQKIETENDRTAFVQSIFFLIRDKGFGYRTPKQLKALTEYHPLVHAWPKLDEYVARCHALGGETERDAWLPWIIALDLARDLALTPPPKPPTGGGGGGGGGGEESDDDDDQQGGGSPQPSDDETETPPSGGGEKSDDDRQEEVNDSSKGDSDDDDSDGDSDDSDSDGDSDSDSDGDSDGGMGGGSDDPEPRPFEDDWDISQPDWTDVVDSKLNEAQAELRADEEQYKPWSYDEDDVRNAHQASDWVQSNVSQRASAESGSAKRALNRLFLGFRRETRHGTKRGKLSTRRLVPSKVELSQGVVPTRPMRKDVDIIKPNIALSVVVDGSSSMDSHTSPTASGLYALMDAFSAVGAKTEALAFMRGSFYGTGDHYTRKCEATIRYHKRFSEKWNLASKKRCSEVYASGGTPTADGIYYALYGEANNGLYAQEATHKVLLVLTDGAANGDHQAPTRYMVRRAREKGVVVVGVGLGDGISLSTLQNLFGDDSLALPFEGFAKELIALIKSRL